MQELFLNVYSLISKVQLNFLNKINFAKDHFRTFSNDYVFWTKTPLLGTVSIRVCLIRSTSGKEQLAADNLDLTNRKGVVLI